MKRFQEKIKDIVEVHSLGTPVDVMTDPSGALASYRFTDATSDIMAKWLDAIANVQVNKGAGRAMTGLRGAGKSHFLATIAAIVGVPELRPKITDSHVAASAERLKRRKHVVAIVRRGTQSTLIDEVRDALGFALDLDSNNLGDTLAEMLPVAASKSGDAPLVMIFDTTGVAIRKMMRDDGEVFAEIIKRIATLNIFVAVALDDRTTGTDGVFAAIAQGFPIDYLDQEHVCRVVESHLFPKVHAKRNTLHELYTEFRQTLSNFQWSEQRFSALYPLHPNLLENAQFIRLYAPEFGLLPFASETGQKISGRPAESLITLVDVFDRVEPALRKADDLAEAFVVFDKLSKEVVGQVPLMQRLHAKFVLKGIFLLSLHGEGLSAKELCDGLLIYSDNDSQKSVKDVEELLGKFATTEPDGFNVQFDTSGARKFSFRIGRSEDLNRALSEKAVSAPDNAVEMILRRFSRERFVDWMLGDGNDENSIVSWCEISWRGGMRRGQVIWNGFGAPEVSRQKPAELLDWEIFVGSREKAAENLSQTAIPTAHWITGELKADEIELLRRYYVLLNDPSVTANFHDQTRAAIHTLERAAKKIWSRVFFQDAKLILNGRENQIVDDETKAPTLHTFLSLVLHSFYEERYPQHPFFGGDLTMSEVSKLVSEHFSGVRPKAETIQELAASFAAPLGLVALVGDDLLLESSENIAEQPFAKIVFGILDSDPSETITLDNIYKNLACEPYGLTRESQNLILGALAAHGILEFVTSKGDRIGRRSLDLKIIWHDIIGVGRPHVRLKSNEELTQWARILILDESLTKIEDPQSAAKTEYALTGWNEEWKNANLLARFEELPDDIVNTRIWRIANLTQKSFGAVSATLDKFNAKNITLEDCLQKIADAFSNSEGEFANRNADLATLVNFVSSAGLRQDVLKYLVVCELTDDVEIENLRRRIFALIEHGARNPSKETNLELEERWKEFRARFIEYFIAAHDSVMKTRELQEKFEAVLRSDEWWEFENLSALPIFSETHWKKAQLLKLKFSEMDCRGEIREVLKTQPTCVCSFRLLDVDDWLNVAEELRETIQRGRASYRKTLRLLTETLKPIFEKLSETEKDKELSEAAKSLVTAISQEDSSPFNNAQLVVIKKAIQTMQPPILKISVPSNQNSTTRDEIREHFRNWIDELPGQPVIFKY